MTQFLTTAGIEAVWHAAPILVRQDKMQAKSIKTDSVGYQDVKTAIQILAETAGQSEDEIRESLTRISRDGKITKKEIQKSVFDRDGNGYDQDDLAAWKKITASLPTKERSAPLRWSFAVLSGYGLVPEKISEAFRFYDRMSVDQNASARAKVFETPQQIEINGVKFESVKRFRLHENGTLAEISFETPQVIEVQGNHYDSVKGAWLRETGKLRKIFFDVSQSVVIDGQKYESVKSFGLHDSGAPSEFAFAIPQSLEIKGERYDKVTDIWLTMGGRIDDVVTSE